MKHLTFLAVGLLFLLSSIIINPATTYAAGEGKITPIPKVNKEFLIVVHIVTNSDSIPGITEEAILKEIAASNVYFEPMGVSFKVCEFKYIYNGHFNNLNDETQDELFKMARLDNRINMFYASTFSGKQSICGNATLGGIADTTSGGILILKEECNNAKTIAHELGHYFSLEHTFEKKHGSELANGSNCATTGDGLCDTPADPFIVGQEVASYINISSCEFIFTGKDANGNYYAPDVSNVMSYYPNQCVCSRFTHDQYVKMANYYLSHAVMW